MKIDVKDSLVRVPNVSRRIIQTSLIVNLNLSNYKNLFANTWKKF